MTRWIAAVVLACFLMADATAQDRGAKVSGRVLDAQGKPVSGAHVAAYWIVGEKDGKQVPLEGATTDAEGRFTAKVDFYGRDAALMAMTDDQKSGGLAVLSPKDADTPVEIRLVPTVHVHGTFASKELGHVPLWTNVYINLQGGKIRLLQNSSRKAEFSMILPAGEYQMYAYGQDVEGLKRTLTPETGKPDLDLGAVELPASIIAQHKGKELPPWSLADARGVKKDVTPADYRGKWLLIDVWGHWCGPCVSELAHLIDFYEDHAEHRDKFEILALHDGTVKDFAEMDVKTASTKKSLWKGRDLPFPILLDADNEDRGATVKAYGIRSFPTTLLIDPDGKLVGEVSLEDLARKLPEIPLAVRVSRALDRGVDGYFEDGPLDKNIEALAKFAGVPIALDEAALKAIGVEAGVKVPFAMGGGVSLRSWLELMLDPLGLAAVVDGEKILVTKAKTDDLARVPTEGQKLCAEAIEAKLATQKVSFDFKGITLAQLVEHFEGETRENFVLDPSGRKSGAIDPEAVVTGSAHDLPVREAVERLLKPLGMKLVVKDEVVVIVKASD